MERPPTRFRTSLKKPWNPGSAQTAISVDGAERHDQGLCEAGFTGVHGHSPDDVCLGTLVPSSPIKAEGPLGRNHTRFVATLTAKAIKQLNKVGINNIEKRFKGKTVRVTGPIS
jgi:hypothetical protein